LSLLSIVFILSSRTSKFICLFLIPQCFESSLLSMYSSFMHLISYSVTSSFFILCPAFPSLCPKWTCHKQSIYYEINPSKMSRDLEAHLFSSRVVCLDVSTPLLFL
jgi:hypothetical protein